MFKRTFRSQVLLKPGLLLPQKVERGGNFYLTAVVEHVQGEQEEVEYTEQGQDENTEQSQVEYTEQGQDENTEHGQVENIEQSQAEYT